MEKIKAVIMRPGKLAEIRSIDNTLEAFQETVDGNIETVTINENTVIVCNEEGRLLDLPYNFSVEVFGHTVDFVGTVIVCGAKDGEFADCPAPVRQRAEQLGEAAAESKGKTVEEIAK